LEASLLLSCGQPVALPSAEVERVHRWCSAQVPDEQQDRVRVVGPRHLTILEESPPWDGVGEWSSMPVVRLRTAEPLLADVERDETGICWG
jgi:hypothetical protein